MTGEEIKSTFGGNTYHWKHVKRADSGKECLDPSGKTTGVKNGKSREGTWKINGDQICFKNTKSKQSACRDIVKGKSNDFYLINPSKGRVVHIKKVESGNTI